MDSLLLRGILIGLLFGMPVGAVGTMTVQRILNYGVRTGLITGLGSSVSDCVYACIGAFGLTFISDFLLHYQKIINILGGSLVLVMGISLLFPKNKNVQLLPQTASCAKMFISSFAVGITNPAAILTFIFAFSYFGISKCAGMCQGIQLVSGVFIGTYIWWVSLSTAIGILKSKTNIRNLKNMNRIFGTILILFGAVIFVKTIPYECFLIKFQL